ncbi:site-specific DNA-methyltransferase [Campylobacter jejuni]|uniref:site-specific DNA-methyltransferase n=2 Tax=Campylobacter jejuni TaxID=197 RepID=UPI000F7FCEE6|nr:site-specific DNA-methyltransferase [Campylobacter jejuni]RTH92514.1 site-specific DNA-methyltransferase [Campylobacter jejuni]
MNLKEKYYDFYFYDLAKYTEKSLFNKILNKRLNIFEKISCYLDTNNIDESILNHFFDEVFFSYKNKNFRDLYFIKNQKVYTNKEVKIKNYIIKFDLKYFDVYLNNNRDTLSFDLENIENNIITINVYSYNKGNLLKSKNEVNENILLFLKEKNIELEEKDIIKAVKSFKRVKTKPIMFYKTPKETFKKSLDTWIFNIFYKDGTIDNIINKSYNHFLNIIDLVADFENELTAMWLKPKFAKNAHYVFSLDTIKSHSNNADEILKSIYKDTKFKEQIAEWKELNFINDEFDIKAINDEKYKFLPLDTKYLSEENYYKLLQSFENLDEILNGELVKADNFQALNSLMSKYQGKIDLIYIDPPYNTGNDGFVYLDNFDHASWLSMMSDRLKIARANLNEGGVIYVNIDYNEVHYLKVLMDEIFGRENFITQIIWRMGFLSGYKTTAKKYIRNYDCILFYSKTQNYFFKKTYIYNKDFPPLLNKSAIDAIFKEFKFDKTLKDDFYEFVNHKNRGEKYPLEDTWNCSKWDKLNSVAIDNSTGRLDETVMIDDENFKGQKPEALIARILEASTNENNLVMDFFAGSGTTLATAHKMRRKWLGVEMGEHFDTVILPRMKKVLSGEQGRISKAANFSDGGCFKYYELESHEESLESISKNQKHNKG